MEEESRSTGEVFSPLQVYFYLINSIMGSGFLGIPYVFQVAGDVFSFVMLILFTWVSYYHAMILVEAMSRAEAIQRIRDDGVQELIPRLKRVMSCETPGNNTSLLSGEMRYEPQITPRKFELAEMHNLCLGSKARYFYMVFMVLTYWGALLSYSSVFGSSMVEIIPLFGETCNVYTDGGFGTTCRAQYWIWVAGFSAFTITFVLLGLKEQKWFQYGMSYARFSIIGLIIILCIVKIGQGSVHAPTFANPAGFGHISAIVFANTAHPSIPTYTQYMFGKRENIGKVLSATFLTTFVLYGLLGFLTSITFDKLPGALITLAWADYGSENGGAWWAYMFQYIILLFPALDAISAFPLNGIVLAENMMSIKYPQLTIEQMENLPKRDVYTFRLATVVPPLIISVITYDLGVAQEFAGMTDYYVVFINIALLHMFTMHRFPRASVYEGWWSSKKLALAMFYVIVPLAFANLAYIIVMLALA